MTARPSPASPEKPRRWRPWRVALVVVIVSAIVAGGAALTIWWMLRPAVVPPLEANWNASVYVLAGDGVREVRDGDASHARFSEPFGIAVGADGVVYVADAGEADRIRRITPDGQVSTVAGGTPGFADGAGSAARFSTPSGLARDASGNVYVADTGNHAIRRLSPDGQVTTIAGDGTAGFRDGMGREARFRGPIGVTVDRSGRILVADTYNDRIRAIDADGRVWTLAGDGEPGHADGPGREARFHTPSGVAVDGAGLVYVADTGNNTVRIIDRNGVVSTPEWATTLALFRPVGIAIGGDDDVYVTDDRGRIVAITRRGASRTLAGSTAGYRDGPGIEARFRNPSGLAIAAPGRLLVGDAGNGLVRLVAAPLQLAVRLPSSPLIAPHFDAASFARDPLLWPVAPFEGPHEIAGTIGEMRGSEGAGRFHAGVDVRIDEGTRVHAVRDGLVSSATAASAFGTLNESVRIGNVAYVHIRVGRDRRNMLLDDDRFIPHYVEGKLVEIRVRRGARFSAGEQIGTVNPFNHVHLNVGWPGEEYNPLKFKLVNFADTVAPTIARGGVRLFDDHGTELRERHHKRLVVSGRVQIVVDAWDQADGNRADRRLGLYDLGYQVLNPDGSPAPGFAAVRHTMRFDRLTQDPDAAGLVYAHGSGIPFYGRRRTQFLYVVTNSLQDGVASPGYWDTAQLAPGDYTLRVWISDIQGNVATGNRDVAVTIVAPDAAPAAAVGPGPS